jgi:hypothetical protein
MTNTARIIIEIEYKGEHVEVQDLLASYRLLSMTEQAIIQRHTDDDTFDIVGIRIITEPA